MNGRVTDRTTGTPLAGATVTLTDRADQFLSHDKTDSGPPGTGRLRGHPVHDHRHAVRVPARPGHPEGDRPCLLGEISGKVTDAATGKILPGATVALSHEGRHLIAVTTDSRGVYDVWLKATVPTVTVTHDGYGKRSKKVSVKRGSLTKAGFALPSS